MMGVPTSLKEPWESGDADDDDELADFIVEDEETEDFDFHDPFEEMFQRDFDEHFNNNRADDPIMDNDDDDEDSGSDFDDDVRFFLADTSDSLDDFLGNVRIIQVELNTCM